MNLWIEGLDVIVRADGLVRIHLVGIGDAAPERLVPDPTPEKIPTEKTEPRKMSVRKWLWLAAFLLFHLAVAFTVVWGLIDRAWVIGN